MSISTQELSKAKISLDVSLRLLRDAAVSDPKNFELHKALRDSCIQRFEFCVELSWKISLKLLGLPPSAPNPAIREMAQNGLIDDPKLWFDFLEARNKSSHTYDEDIAQEVFAQTKKIGAEMDKLLARLNQLK